MKFYKIIKPILFLFPPETAHHIAMLVLKYTSPFIPKIKKNNPITVAGLKFPNRVGLAAGFDKSAKWINPLSKLGFGHIEIGTVTPIPQKGNDKPRLFRLPKDLALINRMGFNNDGSLKISTRLKKLKSKKVIIGGNIGKNKWTDENKANFDYASVFIELWPHVDYFTVNVSSPNTPGLRTLQEKKPLQNILKTLQNCKLQKENPKPIFVKIAPDIQPEQILDILDVIKETKSSGIVVTNTTLSRSNLTEQTLEVGGLSGMPLKEKSLNIIKFIRNQDATIPIIGVGGIMSSKDADDYFKSGANLVQIYTGFIYHGPQLIKDIINL